jgi:t-SNARE complex subunit (syntaxin)
VRLAAAALLLAAACGHGDAALREEQARTRRYRDAYETQAQEIQQLKKRVAELEAKGCK